MGLLSGSISVTRFTVASTPDEPDFDQVPFRGIQPGSEVRESQGFVPFEPEAPYQVGHRRYAFRVRIDRVRPDPTLLKERLAELVRTEMESTGAAYVGPKKRKELRQLAEEELVVQASPQSRIVEGVLDDHVLYLGTTANNRIGTILLLLRRLGVIAEFKTPWIDLGDPEVKSDLVPTGEASQSVLGCQCLKQLVDDREVMFEPEAGNVRLQTREAKVTLTGGVLPELLRYLKREQDVEVLAAKLLTPEARFRLDGLSWRLSSLSIETGGQGHWIERLDERMEKIVSVFELLDRKYAEFRKGGGRAVSSAVETGRETALAEP